MAKRGRKTTYFSPQAKARLDAVLRKASVEIKTAIQNGLNDFVEQVATQASLEVNNGTAAIGPRGELLQTDSGAMSAGYYWVKYHNGKVTTNHDESNSAVMAHPKWHNKTMPKGGDKPYPITRQTRRLHARVGNASAHGVYWEEGHFNTVIGGVNPAVFSQAPVIESLMAQGGKTSMLASINRRLVERGIKKIKGREIR